MTVKRTGNHKRDLKKNDRQTHNNNEFVDFNFKAKSTAADLMVGSRQELITKVSISPRFIFTSPYYHYFYKVNFSKNSKID
jgi:hypothetical protein